MVASPKTYLFTFSTGIYTGLAHVYVYSSCVAFSGWEDQPSGVSRVSRDSEPKDPRSRRSPKNFESRSLPLDVQGLLIWSFRLSQEWHEDILKMLIIWSYVYLWLINRPPAPPLGNPKLK